MSYTASYFHIVFGSKKRQNTLSMRHKEELRRYIYGIAENLHCEIISLNMMPDHVHILANLSSEVSLAKFVGSIKQSSSLWLNSNINFAMLIGWSKEYYGVSVSPTNKESVKGYIMNQEQHHGARDFESEMRWLVESIGMQYFEDSFN